MVEKQTPAKSADISPPFVGKSKNLGGKKIFAVLILGFLFVLWAGSASAGSITTSDQGGGNGIYANPTKTPKHSTITPTPACEAKHYIVKTGDTVYKIAASFNADWQDLVDINDLKAPYVIYVNQDLCLPSYIDKPASQATADAESGAYDPSKHSDFIVYLSGGMEFQVKTINFPPKDFKRVTIGITQPPYPPVENDPDWQKSPDWVWLGDFGTLKTSPTTAIYRIPENMAKYRKLWMCVHSYVKSVKEKPNITMCKLINVEQCRDVPCWTQPFKR